MLQLRRALAFALRFCALNLGALHLLRYVEVLENFTSSDGIKTFWNSVSVWN